MAAIAALVTLASIGIAPAREMRVNNYYVQAVTIKVDRGSRMLSGKVVADSVDVHFCTSSNDWPLNVRMVKPGKDPKIVHTRTNYSAEWHFKLRSLALKGKRVYAQVPSFHNNANGFCNGARSRTVRAP